MAGSIPARLSAAEGRKFGLTVGSAFLVLAAVLRLWRGATTVPVVFVVIGSLLVLGALVVPAHLGPVQRGWMRLAHLLSRVTTPVFMGIVYFLIFTPVGIVRRALGKNSLERREGDSAQEAGSFWFARGGGKTRGNLERQF